MIITEVRRQNKKGFIGFLLPPDLFSFSLPLQTPGHGLGTTQTAAPLMPVQGRLERGRSHLDTGEGGWCPSPLVKAVCPSSFPLKRPHMAVRPPLKVGKPPGRVAPSEDTFRV